MPEYITRDDAIDLIFIASEQGRAAKALRLLKERCVDAVEVTWCGDCRYAHRHPDTEEYWCNKLAGLFSKVDKDEYCSRGERMDGEKE